MQGLPQARQALARFFGSAGPATGMQTPPDAADAMSGVRAIARRRRTRLARFAAWVNDYLDSARRRNEQAAIEETKSYLRAKRRSLTLMLSLLNPQQREEFRNYHYFHVIGGKTGARYRIRVASFANIDIIGPNGRTMSRICAHPAGDVPVYDVMAAQMLHLSDAATEKTFLRYANVHPVVGSERRTDGAFWVP
jgi:hypothetical protein